MCYVVIAGGPNKDLSGLSETIRNAEYILCADSGADELRRLSILPHAVWGDMDSIDEKTVSWLKENQVDHRLFPVEKDMTDSELCLTSIPKDKKILFITSLLGRLDHVMTNLLLVMRLKEEGYDITVTDGNTWVYPLCGPNRWRAEERFATSDHVISVLPLGKGARAVSTVGLKYPLFARDLEVGSSLTVSNEFDLGKKEHGFDMTDGTMLVIVSIKS
ncbi:MAG: thiamine diphosphokinase [Clostridiales bacterium]|nr:thiamine diphosphokinase [Clostridiales bacterium]